MKLNIKNIFSSSNEELKKFLFSKIKKEISDFNYEAKKLGFFKDEKKKSLVRTHMEIILTFKRCKIEYYILSICNGSKILLLFPTKFAYDFGDDFYSGLEFCKFLLELQFNCNSLFPMSIDITAEELSILENYDSGFKELLEFKAWFCYVERFNKIVNYFLEDYKNKILISRKDVWTVLDTLENIK